jgi:hypothetical protein
MIQGSLKSAGDKRMPTKEKSLRLIVLALLAWAVLIHSASADQKRKYGKTVSFGVKQGRVGDTCMTIHATLLAPEFLENLERIQTQMGVEFRSRSGIVKTFPETILVNIRTFLSKCNGSTAEQETVREVKLMDSLRFEASWESDSKTSSVNELAVKRSSRTPSAFYHDWLYQLSIPSRDVPLTEHLNVTVFSQDGKKIASFTAAL